MQQFTSRERLLYAFPARPSCARGWTAGSRGWTAHSTSLAAICYKDMNRLMNRTPWTLRVVLPALLASVLLGCGPSGKPDVVIPVVMKRYEFIPPVIRVKKGQMVELDISTADVQHGFSVPDLGIRESIQPHRGAVKVLFRAERAGIYPMTCSIICGPGHDDMVGKIIVE